MLNDIDKAFVKAWLAALRSGDFKQTFEQLQTVDGHCCLGVACVVAEPMFNLQLKVDGGYLEGSNVSYQPGVNDIFDRLEFNSAGFPKLNAPVFEPSFLSLTKLNDGLKLSFSQIADFIEVTYGGAWGI